MGTCTETYLDRALFFDRDGRLISAVILDVADGQIQAVSSIVNPDKLRHLASARGLEPDGRVRGASARHDTLARFPELRGGCRAKLCRPAGLSGSELHERTDVVPAGLLRSAPSRHLLSQLPACRGLLDMTRTTLGDSTWTSPRGGRDE